MCSLGGAEKSVNFCAGLIVMFVSKFCSSFWRDSSRNES